MKIIILCKPEYSSARKTSVFIKNTKNNHSSASDWWGYKKYCFKENAQTLSKNSTTQDLVLKKMLDIFVTVPPLKKILQFQERICLFFLKTQKTTSSASAWWGNSKSSFEENTRTFSKSSTTQEIRISKPEKGLWNLHKKKISIQKLKQWMKTYEMNFINKKTNKKNVLSFVLRFGRSWRAKKAPKLSSEYLNFLAKLIK